MRIYIPSRSRADNQITVHQSPRRWQAYTALVVPPAEVAAYRALDLPVHILTPNVTGIGPVRQWILNHCPEDTCCMLDDDLGFIIRRPDSPAHFLGAVTSDIDTMLRTIEKQLDRYAQVGVCTREGGNRFTEGDVVCTRLLRVLAYHVPTYFATKCKFDRVPVMEDFDVSLQLLRAGYPNLLLTRWGQGQQQSGAPGGCSTYRDMQMQAEAAWALARLHKPFVKVVNKTTKSSFGGGTRTDVVISWKKAYLSSGKELPCPA